MKYLYGLFELNNILSTTILQKDQRDNREED